MVIFALPKLKIEKNKFLIKVFKTIFFILII